MSIDDIRFTELLRDGQIWTKVVITSNTNHVDVKPRLTFEDKNVYEYLREMTFNIEIHLEDYDSDLEFNADFAKYRVLGSDIQKVLDEASTTYSPLIGLISEKILKEVYSVVAKVVSGGDGLYEDQNQIEKQVVGW